MPTFREVPASKQSLYPSYANTREALEEARRLMPDVPQNNFIKALMGYHNTLLAQANL